MNNFRIEDYVYDGNGDYCQITGISSNEFGDKLYEVSYSDGEFGMDTLTEFDITPADDVEIEHDED